jgi:sulfite oxidase
LAGAEITALDAFYSRNHGSIPDIAHDQRRLTVDGLIDKPLTLTYYQLVTGFTRFRLLQRWHVPATGAPNC